MSALDYSTQVLKLLKKPVSNQQSMQKVVAAIHKELGVTSKLSSSNFLPLANDRGQVEQLVKHNRSISLEKPALPKQLPKLKTMRQETSKLGLPQKYTGGVPGVGHYDSISLDKYKNKSPQYKISVLSRSLSRIRPIQRQEDEPKLAISQTFSKHTLKLPFKAHLHGLIPLNLKNYLYHKSPISDLECPAFPSDFMKLGEVQQSAINASLNDIRKLRLTLKRRLYGQK
jgi:hypothetical protein